MNSNFEETVKRYNEIAVEYNRDIRGKVWVSHIEYLNKFEQEIGLPVKKILDAGCGTGKHSLYFALRGYEVHGLDFSEGMLNEAIKNSKKRKININYVLGNQLSIPFPDNFFDGIWSSASLDHFSEKDKKLVLNEFYRILKPGGVVHIWVKNLFAPKYLFRLFQSHIYFIKNSNLGFIETLKSLKDKTKRKYAYIDGRHWFLSTKKSLTKILKEEGFFILKARGMFSEDVSVYAKKQN